MTKDESPELKPCPFCGGESYIYETSKDSDTQVLAQCKGCGAEITFWLPWTAGQGEKVSAWMDVEKRWNTRTDISDARLERAVRAALEAAVDAVKKASDVRCASCGHPRSNHPYRHMFVSGEPTDLEAAIRAIDPAQIVKGMKDE